MEKIIKVAQLTQSSKENPKILDIRDDEEAIVTDYMGGCYSIVVLWDKQDGKYIQMRGQHGAGSDTALHWDHLLEGVPSDCDIIGSTDPSDDISFSENRIKEIFLQRGLTGKLNLYNFANAYIDRSGFVKNVDMDMVGKLDSGEGYSVRK